jgi:hypothetical protein
MLPAMVAALVAAFCGVGGCGAEHDQCAAVTGLRLRVQFTVLCGASSMLLLCCVVAMGGSVWAPNACCALCWLCTCTTLTWFVFASLKVEVSVLTAVAAALQQQFVQLQNQAVVVVG